MHGRGSAAEFVAFGADARRRLRVMYAQRDGDEVWLDLSVGQSAGTAT